MVVYLTTAEGLFLEIIDEIARQQALFHGFEEY
jgi:hypothetical protein